MRPENFVVWNDFLEASADTVSMLFEPDEAIVVVDGASTFADILVAAGVFSSKSQARKNAHGLELGAIGPGFHWLGPFGRVGRMIYVWSPPPPIEPESQRTEVELFKEHIVRSMNYLDDAGDGVSFSYGCDTTRP